MPQPGLSMADLTERAQVPTLRRNPSSTEMDPLEEASKITRRVVADSMIARTVDQTRADSARSEAETAKAKAEAAKAQAEYEEILERKKSGSSNQQFQEFVMEQLQSTQAALAETKEQLNAQSMAMLEQRLGLLQGQLDSLAQTPREAVSPLALLRSSLEEHQQITQLLAPAPAEAASENPANSPMVEAWLAKAKLEHEYKSLIHHDEHEARMEDLRVKREVGMAEVAVKERTAEQITRGLTDTMPKVLDLLKDLSKVWLNGQAPGTASANAALAGATTAGDTRPPNAGAAPAGFVMDPCPDCGWAVYYKEEWSDCICSHCGKVLTITPSHGADASAPAATQGTPGIGEDEEQ